MSIPYRTRRVLNRLGIVLMIFLLVGVIAWLCCCLLYTSGGAHGDAHDVAHAQTHGTRQRGHVAVVGHHDGNVADLLGGAVVKDVYKRQLPMYLEKEGYAVTVAADGGQGLAKFRAIKPDLVLLDVMMPVMRCV